MSDELNVGAPVIISQRAKVNDEFSRRLANGLTAVGFDPSIFLPMITDFLMTLFTGCGGGDITPEQAIQRVKNLSGFQQSYIYARWKRHLEAHGVRKSESVASKTLGVVRNVAKSSTPEEQLAFANTIINVVADPFDMG